MSISRRNFLRGVGIGCSACAIGSFPPGALARNSPESIKGKTALTPSLCEMCSFRCPIQAQVINNKPFLSRVIPMRLNKVREFAREGEVASAWSTTHIVSLNR